MRIKFLQVVPKMVGRVFFRHAMIPAWCFCMAAAAGGPAAALPAAGVPEWLVSCVQAGDGRVTAKGAAMGTVFTVRAYPGPGMSGADTEKACLEALACARYWEKVMSAMDAESGLAALNAAASGAPVPVSSELEWVLRLSVEYARLTRGAFDPTLGPCIRLWKKARRSGVLPSGRDLAHARRASGWEKLSVEKEGVTKAVEGMRLDLGGIGKGVAVDRMAEVLKGKGVASFCLDSTSDVLAGAPPPGREGWQLRVETAPQEFRMLLLKHAAVSTSGPARQFVRIGGIAYSHVLDPATGLGVTAGRQASVKAPCAALADALSTAACVMPEREFRELVSTLPGVSLLGFFRNP